MFQGVLVMPRKLYLFRAMEIKLPEDTEAEVHRSSSRYSQKFRKFLWKNTRAGVSI